MRIRTTRDVGAAIRDRRRRLRWDQLELAKRMGVSRKWVVEIERGKPRAAIQLVLRALEALGITLRVDGPPATSRKNHRLPEGALDVDAIVEAHKQTGRAK